MIYSLIYTEVPGRNTFIFRRAHTLILTELTGTNIKKLTERVTLFINMIDILILISSVSKSEKICAVKSEVNLVK